MRGALTCSGAPMDVWIPLRPGCKVFIGSQDVVCMTGGGEVGVGHLQSCNMPFCTCVTQTPLHMESFPSQLTCSVCARPFGPPIGGNAQHTETRRASGCVLV